MAVKLIFSAASASPTLHSAKPRRRHQRAGSGDRPAGLPSLRVDGGGDRNCGGWVKGMTTNLKTEDALWRMDVPGR